MSGWDDDNDAAPPELCGEIELPEKGWPVLGGAAAAGATHLITGDVQHFGRYFGKQLLGVQILKPSGVRICTARQESETIDG